MKENQTWKKLPRNAQLCQWPLCDDDDDDDDDDNDNNNDNDNDDDDHNDDDDDDNDVDDDDDEDDDDFEFSHSIPKVSETERDEHVRTNCVIYKTGIAAGICVRSLWSGLLNMTRPLQRASTVPPGDEELHGASTKRHVHPGVPLRSVSQVRDAQTPLSA